MRLIIHIGLHKTGTSSVQAFCNEHREFLISNSVLYPTTCLKKLRIKAIETAEAGHREFQKILMRPKTKGNRDLLEAMKSEAEAVGVDTVLISSETFFGPLGRRRRRYQRAIEALL